MAASGGWESLKGWHLDSVPDMLVWVEKGGTKDKIRIIVILES